jgi:tetratricopeptide (TPR) repeat protein
MGEAQKTRRQLLEEAVSASPDDAFARYGLALECANAGETSAADEHFHHLLTAHPDYVPGYYHYGQLLLRLERVEDARDIFRRGMEQARKAGNARTLSELEAALEECSTP